VQRLGGGDKSWKKESNAAISSFLNNRPLRAKLAKGGPFDAKGGTINFGEFCYLWQQLSGRSAATQLANGNPSDGSSKGAAMERSLRPPLWFTALGT